MAGGTKIRCKKCNEVIQSMYRHDFHPCSCKSIYIDGGSDYLRICGDLDGYDIVKTYGEWVPILEKENNVTMWDNDGGTALMSEGRLDDNLTREEAIKYFAMCTMKWLGPRTDWDIK